MARVRAGTPEPFEPLAADLRQRITACHQAWSSHERDWAHRCRATQPLPLTTGAERGSEPAIAAFSPGEALSGQPLRAAAAILVWMARAFDQPSFDVGYRGAVLDRQLAGLERWFESLPPLRVAVPLDDGFAASVETVMAAMATHDGRGTFLHDVVRRFPELRGRDEGRVASELRVAVTIGDDAADRRDGDAALVVHFSSDGRRCEWRGDPQRLHVPLTVLQSWCSTFLLAAQAAPGVPVWRIPVVTPSERERLLVEWNPPPSGDGAFRSLLQQFDDQVRRSPEATAVVTWQQQGSYRELDRRATRIARALRQRGVGRGAIVGIHLERSVDMIAALLAVLKAGGGLPAPRSHVSAGPARASCSRTRPAALVVTQSPLEPGAPGAVDAIPAPRLTADADRRPRPTRPSRWRQPTSPTSSTPRARPAGPRA